jgi:hypothetical protein
MEQAAGAAMGTRSIRGVAGPEPVRVIATPGGAPHAVIQRRLVVAVRDSWRVQDRWWTDEPVDRSYFDVVLEPGRPVLIYRETSGQWSMHG